MATREKVLLNKNYVYILECSDKSLYTGWTNNLEKRMQAHNEGLASKYTRSRLPVKRVYLEECSTPTEARKREAQIKKLSRENKLAIIKKYRYKRKPV